MKSDYRYWLNNKRTQLQIIEMSARHWVEKKTSQMDKKKRRRHSKYYDNYFARLNRRL